MKYDSKQLELELGALRHNRDITLQQYNKICGAIEMVEAMLKTISDEELKAAKEEKAAEESKEAEAQESQEAA